MKNKCLLCGKETSNPKYCSRECANKNNTYAWAKGKTKEDDPRLAKLGEAVSKARKENPWNSWNKGLTKENSEKVKQASVNMSKAKKDNPEAIRAAKDNLKKAVEVNIKRHAENRKVKEREKQELKAISKEIEKLKRVEKFITQLVKYNNEKYAFQSMTLKEKVLYYLYKSDCQQTKNNLHKDRDWFFNETKRQLYEETSFIIEEDVNARLYALFNDITETPLCKTCGKPLQWNAYHKTFNTFCSKSCSNFDPDIRKKMHNTKKQNNSFNTSSFEDRAFEILEKEYEVVKKQYVDKNRYPYKCDFYIPDKDIFIEINVHWTHGGCPYNKNNGHHQIKLRHWKLMNTDFYNNAIKVWTDYDVKKLYDAKKNQLKYVAIYDWQNKDDFINQIRYQLENPIYNEHNLEVIYEEEDIWSEIALFKEKPGNYKDGGNYNKTILTFQPSFYTKENELWKNLEIRNKLINNREKYLNKSFAEMTDLEILSGFKKSGIYYGYSHFNPFWIKFFIEDFNLSSIYDPCGGWGHRLLGSYNIDYIYNDCDYEKAESVREMWRTIGNTTKKDFHIKDASQFTPHQRYEAVFTCPPYYNTELYNTELYNGENDSYKLYPKYDDWLNIWWRNLVLKSTNKKGCLYFAFVVSDKYKDDMHKVCVDSGLRLLKTEYLGRRKTSHFNSKGTYENLLIYDTHITNII